MNAFKLVCHLLHSLSLHSPICLDIDNIDFAFFYTINYILNLGGSNTAQIIQHNYWIMIAHTAHTSKVKESLRCTDKIVIIILASCNGSDRSDSVPI